MSFQYASMAMQFYQENRRAAAQEAENIEARRAGQEQQSAVTMNIREAQAGFTRASSNIDIAKMQSRSEAVVSAAAAGTAGLSVNDQLLDIERNAARAEGTEREAMDFSIASLERSRRGIQAQVASRTGDASPNYLPAMIGHATETYGNTWDFNSLFKKKSPSSPIRLPESKT